MSIHRYLLTTLTCATLVGSFSTTGFAQISNVTTANSSSGDQHSEGWVTSYARKSSVASSNTASTIEARYAFGLGADTAFNDKEVTMNSSWSLSFDVTAPAGYTVTITTGWRGAVTTKSDGSGKAKSYVNAMSGSQSGGSIVSGTLDAGDPSNISNTGSTKNTPWDLSTTMVLTGVSDGIPNTHTLSFSWSSGCKSNGGTWKGGDECAVRGGREISMGSYSAGDYPGAGGRIESDDGHFVTVTVSVPAVCGDGVQNNGETCDLGAINGTPGSCCDANCSLRSTSFSCRPSTGNCDSEERCTGASAECPADTFAPSGHECRGVAGNCDVAEQCTGASAECPADAFAPSSQQCRGSTGDCDVAEQCTGASADCPADAFAPSSQQCRGSTGDCDAAEHCTGGDAGCPADAFAPSSHVCRGSAGDCDVAEQCTGGSAECPADTFAPSGHACRGVAGNCDVAEQCTGGSAECPADTFAPSGYECRGVAGNCDVAEQCTGANADCPEDAFAPSGQQCRGVAGNCDVAEQCTGANADCPEDAFAADDVECRESAGNCDVAEQCTGANADCPEDAFAADDVECRESAGDCDLAEQCTGDDADCPEDVFEADDVVCREAVSGIDAACDVEETCPGDAVDCPADEYLDDGTECDDADAGTSNDQCVLGLCGCPDGPDLDMDEIPDLCDLEDSSFTIEKFRVIKGGSKPGYLRARGRVQTGTFGLKDVIDTSGGLLVSVETGSGLYKEMNFSPSDCKMSPFGKGTIKCRHEFNLYDKPTIRLVPYTKRFGAPGEYKLYLALGRLEVEHVQMLGGPGSIRIATGDIDRTGEIDTCASTNRGLDCR